MRFPTCETTYRGLIVPAHSNRITPARETYEEVYFENGRWYGTYRMGKYMFPIDEVRPLSHFFILLLAVQRL